MKEEEKKEYISFIKPYNLYEAGEPSCQNGSIQVRKYKTTVEIIDEPRDIICERLEKLWVECDNFHHYKPLTKMAKEYDYKFKGEFRSVKGK